MLFSVGSNILQILFEVPSGVFADFFGRKNALVMAAILKVTAICFFFFGNTFWPFLIGWSIFGMSLAFESGSDSAFIYDTLKELKREKEYKKIEGIAFAFVTMGLGIGGFFGGFLSEISFKLPILLTIFAFSGSIIVGLLLKEPKHHKEVDDKKYFKHLKQAAHFAFKHPKVKWLIVFSGFMMFILLTGHKFYQPYMQLVNIDLKFFGIIYLMWLIISSLASWFAQDIEKKLGEKWSLLMITLFAGVHFILIGRFVFFFGIFIIFFAEFAWGFILPVINDYINKHTESHHRATVLSLKGFFKSIVMILLAPVLGYFADVLSLPTALIILGVFTLVIGTFSTVMILRSNKELAKITV